MSVVNYAAVNMGEQISLGDPALSSCGYRPRSGMAGVETSWADCSGNPTSNPPQLLLTDPFVYLTFVGHHPCSSHQARLWRQKVLRQVLALMEQKDRWYPSKQTEKNRSSICDKCHEETESEEGNTVLW